MGRRPMSYLFDFAISFSKGARTESLELARELMRLGVRVFHADFHRAELWGRRLDRTFGWTFSKGCRFFVPLVSSEYIEREWPQYEWDVAKREQRNRPTEFILPIRLDDSLLPGLPNTIGYVDLRELSIPEIAALMVERIDMPAAIPLHAQASEVWVAAFGVLPEDLDEEDLPELPNTYASACDWLQQDLMARLSQASLSGLRITEDSRNGETFGVRVRFSWKEGDPLPDFSRLGHWRLLEVVPYCDVYSASDVAGM